MTGVMSDKTPQQLDRLGKLSEPEMAGGAGMQQSEAGRGKWQSPLAEIDEFIMLSRTVQHGRKVLEEVDVARCGPERAL
ncbi:MAG TPA: hypothetical protein VNK51_15045 [Bradyrhizobium sp.]|nr:hypothetical protein [Bradyrhizobium sp.]